MAISGKIEVYQGNTWGPYTPTIKHSDGTAYTLPVGAVVLFTVKKPTDKIADDSAALIKKDWSTGPWGLSETDTDIQPGIYEYDVKIISTGVEVNSSAGTFEIKRRITIRDSQ